MRRTLFLDATYDTVALGLKIALGHNIGGRDSLILAFYLLFDRISKLVTLDRALRYEK